MTSSASSPHQELVARIQGQLDDIPGGGNKQPWRAAYALKELEEQVREALSEIDHAERCVTEERKRRVGSMNMTLEGIADDLRRAREALGA